MLILTIRTDNPEAEVGLYQDSYEVAYEKWQAHRELSQTIHKKIQKVLDENGKTFQDLKGIACFRGPGSFTGLRIGLTVGNSIASELKIPIVAAMGDDWQKFCVEMLKKGTDQNFVIPEYGREARITNPKK